MKRHWLKNFGLFGVIGLGLGIANLSWGQNETHEKKATSEGEETVYDKHVNHYKKIDKDFSSSFKNISATNGKFELESPDVKYRLLKGKAEKVPHYFKDISEVALLGVSGKLKKFRQEESKILFDTKVGRCTIDLGASCMDGQCESLNPLTGKKEKTGSGIAKKIKSVSFKVPPNQVDARPSVDVNTWDHFNLKSDKTKPLKGDSLSVSGPGVGGVYARPEKWSATDGWSLSIGGATVSVEYMDGEVQEIFTHMQNGYPGMTCNATALDFKPANKEMGPTVQDLKNMLSGALDVDFATYQAQY